MADDGAFRRRVLIQATVLGMVTGLLGGWLMRARPPEPFRLPDSVEAKQFHVKDADGDSRLVIATFKGNPTFMLSGPKDVGSIIAEIVDGRPMIRLADGFGRVRVLSVDAP